MLIVLLFLQAGELHRAALDFKADWMKEVLAQKPSLNQLYESGRSALHVAIDPRKLAGVSLLLVAGAEQFNSLSPAGTQLMHGAALYARTRDEGQTPLHFAAAMEKMRAVEALLSLGADLKIQDLKGMTALALAERAGLDEVAVVLRRALSQ